MGIGKALKRFVIRPKNQSYPERGSQKDPLREEHLDQIGSNWFKSDQSGLD